MVITVNSCDASVPMGNRNPHVRAIIDYPSMYIAGFRIHRIKNEFTVSEACFETTYM